MATSAIEAWEALFRAQVRVLRALRDEFPEDQLTFTEYDVMFTISREPGGEIRMRDLTRNVLISQSSLSRLADRLVERGLIAKREDPLDGRGAIVSMTDEGRSVFRSVARIHSQSIKRHLGTALNAAELTELERLCVELQQAVPDVAPKSGRAAHD